MSLRLAASFLVSALMLAACAGGRPVMRSEPAKAPSPPVLPLPAPAKTEPAARKPAPAPETKRGGGYYLDDGPAAQIPENLDDIPDAEPKWEPLNRGTARPYVVFGKPYTPLAALKPFRQKGVASWYGKKFHGQKTSSGEPYDMFAMTAAHTVLPIPCYVRVTNPANGRQVVVRVNDRGPFHADRIIDLSYTAAQKLGYVGRGSTEVEIELIIPGDAAGSTYAQLAPLKKSEPKIALAANGRSADSAEDELAALIGRLDAPTGSDKSVANVARLAAVPAGVYLQLGAFGNPDNAENLRLHLERELDWLDGIRVSPAFTASGTTIHRLQAGPYASRAAAEKAADRVRDAMGSRPALVNR
jgi:rare lipoprotein A